MKKVVRSYSSVNASITSQRIDRFAKQLGNAVNVYYQLDDDTQSEIDDILGSDFIVDLEDSIRALSIR